MSASNTQYIDKKGQILSNPSAA